jgi:hypothetical protein
MNTIGNAAISVFGTLVGSAAGIPVLGAVLSASYSRILAPPLTKRTQEFLKTVYDRLSELENEIEGFKIDHLSENPLFITTFLHVYSIALRTHHEEKLEALRNVVINVAKPIDVDDDVSLMFTNFIDTFTPWHIKILEFLDNSAFAINDPETFGKGYSVNVLEYVLNHFSEQRDSAFAAQVIKDLQDRGLIRSDNDPDLIISEDTEKLSSIPNTTPFGRRFLKITHS